MSGFFALGLYSLTYIQVLFAYHLEALVPTTTANAHASQTPQKINGKDVHFFSVGVLQERTLVIYMKKKGVSFLYMRCRDAPLTKPQNSDCVLHIVEPVIDKIHETPKATSNRFIPRKTKAEWFRHFKEFSLPDAHDVIFLNQRIAVLCSKGFMIMKLDE